MRTRGATLIGARSSLLKPAGIAADRSLQVTVETPVTPTWMFHPFGSRLPDPFRARSPPAFHHLPARWGDRWTRTRSDHSHIHLCV